MEVKTAAAPQCLTSAVQPGEVFTREALAYVVDEALQVFGGNGYSREFPAERPYRDARITRISEGTNEINRLIIATRLLKQDVGGHGGADLVSARRGAETSSAPTTVEHLLIARAGRQVIRALNTQGRGAPLANLIAPIAAHPGVDTASARRRIADAVIAAGKHPF